MNMQIGPYTIREELGRGGMAVVYRAVDVRIRKRVALKVLPLQHANDRTFLQRFLREGKNASHLRHGNIVRTYESGCIDGYYYIAMEFINGTTLAEMLRRRGQFLGGDEVISILTQAAAGLDYAHRKGFLHRDIKLSNILISNQGRVVLSDFGISKQLSGQQTAVTRFGHTVGTPTYMSPEQARGARDLDHRSDIYSLGVVAYVMFTGQLPYQAASQPALLHKIVLDDPDDPQTVNPQIHADVAAGLKRALAKDPAHRYQSAWDLVAALNRGNILAQKSFVPHLTLTRWDKTFLGGYTQPFKGSALPRPVMLLADKLARYFSINPRYFPVGRQRSSMSMVPLIAAIIALVVLLFWLLLQSPAPDPPRLQGQSIPLIPLQSYTDGDQH